MEHATNRYPIFMLLIDVVYMLKIKEIKIKVNLTSKVNIYLVSTSCYKRMAILIIKTGLMILILMSID